ncbi:hypothetical protein AAFF_G00374050 [Aldrovandia affinis]|uniref:Uncharacterized protein n=1 Tax=Aldrovandia affinis TaxID=143900 RepID=A0AAD7R504_9TELE|nr:hypothetical protein AAFF_G00374050 [Aldrovandia affinis]
MQCIGQQIGSLQQQAGPLGTPGRFTVSPRSTAATHGPALNRRFSSLPFAGSPLPSRMSFSGCHGEGHGLGALTHPPGAVFLAAGTTAFPSDNQANLMVR